MKRYLITVLLFEICFAQMNLTNNFLKPNHLVLSNGEKTEKIKVGENITIVYQDSVEREVIGEIKAVTNKVIKIKKNDTGQIALIRLDNIKVIKKKSKDRSGSCNGALVGGILSGGFVALIGDWSTPTDMYAGLIITPLAAAFGAGVGAAAGSLSGSVITKTYVIATGEWKIVILKSD